MSTIEPRGSRKGQGADVGARVVALRKALGLTQEQLAERAGLDRTHVSFVETGRNQASSDKMRGALARGFALSREVLALYLSGELPLELTIKARAS